MSDRDIHLHTVSNHQQATEVSGAWADRGANGGVARSDTKLIQGSGRTVNVTGIDSHEIKNVKKKALL